MDKLAQMVAMGAAGAAGAEGPLSVEDVFSIDLFKNDGSIDVNNGIDLSSKGGLVVGKYRSSASDWGWIDSERGITKYLDSRNTNAEATAAWISSFDSDGWTGGSYWGTSNIDCVGWTFRKAPGFFDVVTYTGTWDGVTTPHSQTISHNLGCVPGCIIFKNLDTTDHWVVYHRGTSVPAEKGLVLNADWAEDDDVYFNDTAPTSTHFTVGPKNQTNGNGNRIVAYLFAHDEAVFGENEDQSIIKCGNYTGTASIDQSINVGWEPQWVMIKCASSSAGPANWCIFDNMRGFGVRDTGDSVGFKANLNDQESPINRIHLNSTGFEFQNEASGYVNASGQNYVYIAIRRGPMKTPEDATTVFKPLAYSGSSSAQSLTIGFPGDFYLGGARNGSSQSSIVADKLRKSLRVFYTSRTDGDETLSGEGISFTSDTLELGTTIPGWGIYNFGGYTFYGHVFRRAPGFFDMVAYTGTGSNGLNVTHNLGVTPEMMWIKKRTTTTGGDNWQIYHSSQGNGKYALLKTDPFYTSAARWNNTSPTSTQFTLGTDDDVNTNTHVYIAYLFATLPGISKVGSYSGTGSAQNIDCGFTNGARFVLIKRADLEVQGSAPDRTNWYLWDSVRGIVSGNDPWIALNETDAEVTTTDYIDPFSSGFTVSSTGSGLNASGGTYVFLAIA